MLISKEVVKLFSLMLAKFFLCPTGWFILKVDDGAGWYTIYYCTTSIRVDDIRGVTLSLRLKIFPRSRQEVKHLDWLERKIWLEQLLAWDIMDQQVDRKKTKWMMMRKQRGARRGLFIRHDMKRQLFSQPRASTSAWFNQMIEKLSSTKPYLTFRQSRVLIGLISKDLYWIHQSKIVIFL